MNITVADWIFDVDPEATLAHTVKNSTDHCTCAYCRNYYEALSHTYPELLPFLRQFGIDFNGPSELMPFTPTLMLACYRVHGKILNWGREVLSVGGVPVLPESSDDGTFFLWVGELELPWLQEEDMDEVVSPANLPEFLLRMEEIWRQRHEDSLLFS